MHYLALLERKTGALEQAAPLEGWQLPEEFVHLRRLLQTRMGKAGSREYIQVLRLLEDFRLEEVRAAVGDAMRLGAIVRIYTLRGFESARRSHNQLGLAYQIAFIRLTGRAPGQQPFCEAKGLAYKFARFWALPLIGIHKIGEEQVRYGGNLRTNCRSR